MSCLRRANQKTDQPHSESGPHLRCLLPPCSTRVAGFLFPACQGPTRGWACSLPGPPAPQPLQSPISSQFPRPLDPVALSPQPPSLASSSSPNPIHPQTKRLCQPPAPEAPSPISSRLPNSGPPLPPHPEQGLWSLCLHKGPLPCSFAPPPPPPPLVQLCQGLRPILQAAPPSCSSTPTSSAHPGWGRGVSPGVRSGWHHVQRGPQIL